MAEEKTYNKVCIVNDLDEVIGVGDMMVAIKNGLLRSGVRVFVFNQSGAVLLQRRSEYVRYPLLLDISASGHVDEGETRLEAAHRELQEELGIAGLELTEIAKSFRSPGVFNGIYKLVVPDDIDLSLNEEEVAEVVWMTATKIDELLDSELASFTNAFVDTWNRFRDKLIEI